MITGDFVFHPIGQGCFYTGKLYYGSKEPKEVFNLVYDCGTNSKIKFLNQEIKQYKATLPLDTIDLIIISHFDADHVNGITTLLKGVKCRRLVIPYYNPYERLFLLLNSKIKNPDYITFLSNPINYFSNSERFNIGEIIIVSGPSSEEPTSTSLRPPKKPIDKYEFTSPLELSLVESQNNENIDEMDLQTEESVTVKYVHLPFLMTVGSVFWEFLFFLREFNDKHKLNLFKNEIDSFLNGNSILYLFDKNNLKKVKDIYERYYQDVNFTSLCVYHGPLFESKMLGAALQYSQYYNYIIDLRPGSLLTGDISLKKQQDCRNFINYYLAYIQDVSLLQVPHHGSKSNWAFYHPSGLEVFQLYIINYGIGRKHHPSSLVVADILANCSGGIILNDETNRFQYTLYFG